MFYDSLCAEYLLANGLSSTGDLSLCGLGSELADFHCTPRPPSSSCIMPLASAMMARAASYSVTPFRPVR